MREFWVASGHHLTRRADHGGLVATPELIMAYLARPELMPPADACDAERDLHASLMADPAFDDPAKPGPRLRIAADVHDHGVRIRARPVGPGVFVVHDVHLAKGFWLLQHGRERR